MRPKLPGTLPPEDARSARRAKLLWVGGAGLPTFAMLILLYSDIFDLRDMVFARERRDVIRQVGGHTTTFAPRRTDDGRYDILPSSAGCKSGSEIRDLQECWSAIGLLQPDLLWGRAWDFQAQGSKPDGNTPRWCSVEDATHGWVPHFNGDASMEHHLGFRVLCKVASA
mmetsp:Transcript_39788/g.112754  ORF Transcript_39788/g.112754 Transcript_39788/m.112754 type:complete len:169 (+) Transcript_39788:59-565(+)